MITTTYSRETETTFILTKLAELTLVFPTGLVSEILIIDPAKILSLPFYDSAVLGCIHQGGRMIPLISLAKIFLGKNNWVQQNLTAVRLSETAGEISGCGLVVEGLLGSQTKAQLPPELFKSSKISEPSDQPICLFKPELLSPQIWQPQRWLGDKKN